MKRRPYWLFAAFACLTLAGCSRKVLADGSIEFAVESWVPLLIVLAGAAASAIGVVLLFWRKWVAGIVLTIVGLGAAGALAPGLYMDRVLVDDEGFYSSHGLWFNRIEHKVRYDDLSLVQVVVEERTGRRGRKEHSYFFDCTFKSRPPERIPLGDLMREALPDILAQFEEHNVPVAIPPNLP